MAYKDWESKWSHRQVVKQLNSERFELDWRNSMFSGEAVLAKLKLLSGGWAALEVQKSAEIPPDLVLLQDHWEGSQNRTWQVSQRQPCSVVSFICIAFT
eukprot:6426626-Amphidinium_carterae.1